MNRSRLTSSSEFVDTSIWYAAADRNDASHVTAAEILRSGERLLTTDHVVVETWRLLAHRMGWHAAEDFVERILGGAVEIESVRQADIELAWQVGFLFPDQELSIVDRTSFAVMQRLGMLRVATFDHHFSVYRFRVDRRRAFTVVR